MAEQFGNIFSGLTGIFHQMNTRQKTELLMITLMTIAAFSLIVWWAGQTQYEVLFYDMSSSETGAVVEKLKESNVSYKIENGGTKILVPTDQVQELRLKFARQGLPESGLVGYEIFDKSNLGMSNFVQQINYRRALEGELSRTLNQMEEIKSSRVHIVIPEEKLFKEDEQSPTASVILTLVSSSGLSQSHIKGIARLISSSIEGLSPENVTIIDSYGNVLSKGESSNSMFASSSDQLELQKAVEEELIAKSQEMLEKVVGIGNSITRVNAQLDFETLERTSEIFDPDGQVVRSEQFTNTSSTGTDTTQTSKESATTKYEINRTLEKVMSSAGGIERLTIAVLINGKYVKFDDPEDGEKFEMRYEPRSEEEIADLTNIVKTAVGFDEERGDKIEVIGMQFSDTGEVTNAGIIEETDFQLDYMDIAKKAGMVLIALAVLFLLRSMSKNTGSVGGQPSLQANYPVLSAAKTGTIALPNESDIPKLGESVLPEAVERNKIQSQISRYSIEQSAEATSLLRSWLMED